MKLIFLHGWGYTPAIWDALRTELTEFESLAPALHAPDGSLEDWADALAPTLPDGSLLVGWSLGAQLASALASRHPARFKGAFLIGFSPKFVADDQWRSGLDAKTFSHFSASFRSAPAKTLKRFLALQILGDANRAGLLTLLERALSDPEKAVSLDKGLAMLEHTDLRDLTWPLDFPVYLLHGEQDALMPCAAAQWMATQHPQWQLEILADAGHAPCFGQPRELAGRLREFVREC